MEGGAPTTDLPAARAPGVAGRLVVSRLAEGDGNRSVAHRSVFVNGRSGYGGQTGNDLRGFLDGGFAWGWNQASQVHLRLGRMYWPGAPRFGETELFRVLLRWTDVRLPRGARVDAARIRIVVEEPPPDPVRLYLYAVRREFGPGGGGVHGDNVSVPAAGEVWWREARHGEEPWGLPGAGYAAGDGGGDTGPEPLAEAGASAAEERVVFESRALGAEVERVARGDGTLRLLLKLADDQEDRPGTFFSVHSGWADDSRNPGRRPGLEVEWTAPEGEGGFETEVRLERGRMRPLPALRRPGTYHATFEAEPGSEEPRIEVRRAGGGGDAAWRRARFPLEVGEASAEVRLRALRNPVALGEAFEAELRDTWVVTGPPEDQQVPWTFRAPSGRETTVEAAYVGDFRWRVRFEPDEPGRWTYRWRQSFFREPRESGDGVFDVMAESLESVLAALERLGSAVEAGEVDDPGREGQMRLMALERAGVALLDPDRFRGPEGEALRTAVRGVRGALWGRPLPDPLPMESHPRVTERDGRPVETPYPDGRGYGLGSGSDDGRDRSGLFGRALRRLRGLAGRGRSD